jgi:hypothetical protein
MSEVELGKLLERKLAGYCAVGNGQLCPFPALLEAAMQGTLRLATTRFCKAHVSGDWVIHSEKVQFPKFNFTRKTFRQFNSLRHRLTSKWAVIA